MPRVRLINLITGYSAQFLPRVISILVTPIFLASLGPDYFGILGFLAGLVGVLTIFNHGLGRTVLRVLSSSQGETEALSDDQVRLFRTLCACLWIGGAVLALLLIPFSGTLAHFFASDSTRYTPDQLTLVFALISASAVIQFVTVFYISALAGLNRQYIDHSAHCAVDVLRFVGGVGVIWWSSNALVDVFVLFTVLYVLRLVFSHIVLWRFLDLSKRRFELRFSELAQFKDFVLGMTGIVVMLTLITTSDKFIIASVLSLDQFGYYVLAFSLANMMTMLSTPITVVYMPTLTAGFAAHSGEQIRAKYRDQNTLLSLALLPTAVVILVFPTEVLWIYTRSVEAAEQGALCLQLMTLGMLAARLYDGAYVLQTAAGSTRVGLRVNAALAVLVPLSFAGASAWWGIAGSGGVWLLAGAMYLAVGVPMTHRHVLPEAKAADFFGPILKVGTVTFAVAGVLAWSDVMSFYVDVNPSRFAAIVVFGIATVSLYAVALAVNPYVLRETTQRLCQWRHRLA